MSWIIYDANGIAKQQDSGGSHDHTASEIVSGILPVAKGGTGLSAGGTDGHVLTMVTGSPAWAAASGGSPNVGIDAPLANQTLTTSEADMFSVTIPANTLVAGVGVAILCQLRATTNKRFNHYRLQLGSTAYPSQVFYYSSTSGTSETFHTIAAWIISDGAVDAQQFGGKLNEVTFGGANSGEIASSEDNSSDLTLKLRGECSNGSTSVVHKYYMSVRTFGAPA